MIFQEHWNSMKVVISLEPAKVYMRWNISDAYCDRKVYDVDFQIPTDDIQIWQKDKCFAKKGYFKITEKYSKTSSNSI